MKKAVIDVDNTLWHFCDVLYERLKRINGSVPAPDGWTEWEFWERYCSKEDFLSVIEDIHLNQDDDEHLPYPEARDFLATLKKHDFYLIVASHRTPESREQTHRWLVKHDLVFDELHLSHDKTVLFEEDCRIVVDDAPSVLEKAAGKRIVASGLMFPWNKSSRNNGYRLFHSLTEVLGYILDHSLKMNRL
jgi:5'(3')-deoxyribonucleotidase